MRSLLSLLMMLVSLSTAHAADAEAGKAKAK
jgi:hypothetical protein